MIKMTGLILLLCFSICMYAQVDSSAIATVKQAKPFIKFGKRTEKLVLGLEKLFVKDEVFWLEFTIRNNSKLSYPIELFRMYIKDKEAARRSSQQEVELLPLYADTLSIVPAKKKKPFLIALSKFTIPDNKVCLLEMFETNGGRNLTIEISNRQLFLAKTIPDSSKQKK
jgi:hypothetical protein